MQTYQSRLIAMLCVVLAVCLTVFPNKGVEAYEAESVTPQALVELVQQDRLTVRALRAFNDSVEIIERLTLALRDRNLDVLSANQVQLERWLIAMEEGFLDLSAQQEDDLRKLVARIAALTEQATIPSTSPDSPTLPEPEPTADIAIATPPPTQSDRSSSEIEVVAQGIGTSSAEALQNAYSNALHQAIGVYIDAETLVRNQEIIRDQILSHSRGFIKESLVINSRSEHNIFYTTIRATVLRQPLMERTRAILADSVPINIGSTSTGSLGFPVVTYNMLCLIDCKDEGTCYPIGLF